MMICIARLFAVSVMLQPLKLPVLSISALVSPVAPLPALLLWPEVVVFQ